MEQAGHMLGVPVELESYQPVCDVLIRFRQHGIFKEYQRGLDLTKALYSQRYIRQEDRLEHSPRNYSGGFLQRAGQSFGISLSKRIREKSRSYFVHAARGSGKNYR